VAAREQHAGSIAKESWAKNYKPKIDGSKLKTFNSHYRALVKDAETLTEKCSQDVIAWLESVNLINELTEYHQDHLGDGTAFEDVVGAMINGISGCPSGIRKLDQWIDECVASDHNLIWRAIAINQTQGISSINTILAKAKAKKDSFLHTPSLNGLETVQGAMKTLLDLNMQPMGIVNELNAYL